MNLLEKNKSRLLKLFPHIDAELFQLYSPDPSFEILPSRSGMPSARIQERYLHSKHDPIREAERLIRGLCKSSVKVGIFLGFGLGYQVEAFRSLFPSSSVIIVEKEPGFFLQTLATRDVTDLFDENVSLLIGSDTGAIQGIVEDLSPGQQCIVPLTALTSMSEEYYSEVRSRIEAGISRSKVNTATLKRFGRRWVKNLASNLELIEQAGDVADWQDRFRGIPALILAAGPTLDEILPSLYEVSKKSVLICSDTAAPALMKRNIVPDFVVVVDPQYWNSRHLDGIDFSDTILISESASHPNNFRHNYRAVYFSGSMFPLGTFLESSGKSRHKLGAGGSVTTTAWDFARFTGASPILLSGLDLGFPDGQTHFKGAYFEERLHSLSHRHQPHEHITYTYLQSGSPFLYEDYKGSSVLTDQRLAVYRQWFEEQIKQAPHSKNFTLSDRGVKIEGFSPLSPENVLNWPNVRTKIEKQIIATLEYSDKLEAPINSDGAGDGAYRPGEQKLEQLLFELENLKKIAEEGLGISREILKNPAAAEGSEQAELFRSLDSIDHQLLSLSSREIAAFLITPILEEIESRLAEASDLTTNINLSAQLYQEIAEAADFHISLFKKP